MIITIMITIIIIIIKTTTTTTTTTATTINNYSPQAQLGLLNNPREEVEGIFQPLKNE